MGLTLGLRRGHDFFVGEHRFTVETVNDETDFVISNTATGTLHAIREGERTEVLPGVYVSTGQRQHTVLARVQVDAPRSIRISRGEDGAPKRPHLARPHVVHRR